MVSNNTLYNFYKRGKLYKKYYSKLSSTIPNATANLYKLIFTFKCIINYKRNNILQY